MTTITQTARVQLYQGKEWHVAPDGLPTGSGSMFSPWDLQTGITHPSISPGDVVWLHGGTYENGATWEFEVNGTAELPIIYRAYPGEFPRIDTNSSLSGRTGGGIRITVGQPLNSFIWLWGVEIFNSWPLIVGTRAFDPGVGDIDLPEHLGKNVGFQTGVLLSSEGSRVINCVMHDNTMGALSPGDENYVGNNHYYGNVSFNNGYDNTTTRGSGHHFYFQASDFKYVANNCFFAGFSYGLHGYSTAATLWGFWVEGNMTMNIGCNSHKTGMTGNMFGGGGGDEGRMGMSDKELKNPVMRNNYTYCTQDTNQWQCGYAKGAARAHVTDNVFIGAGMWLHEHSEYGDVTGNTFYGGGGISGKIGPDPTALTVTPAMFPNNTYLSSRPTTGTWTYVRPNFYERGRASIAVYNWGHLAEVDVDFSTTGLLPGETFEVRSLQDYYAGPVLEATYPSSGSTTFPLPMVDLTVSTPYGWTAPTLRASPEFAIFIVLPTGG